MDDPIKRTPRALLAALLCAAGGAGAAPLQTVSLAVGFPAASLDFRARVSEPLALGARLSWDELDDHESFSLTALGAAAAIDFDIALGRSTLGLEFAPGADRLSSRYRAGASGALLDSTPVYALRVPVALTWRLPVTDHTRLAFDGTFAPELLLSGGATLSPQLGAGIETDAARAFAIGLGLRIGRIFVVSGAPAVYAGHGAVTLPLAILLTLSWRS